MNDEQAAAQKKKKIGFLFIGILFIAAGIYDLLSIIPLVGSAIGWSLWTGVALVLWKKGYGLINPRRLITMVASTVAEFIPAVQELPLFLAGAVILVIVLKAEEKTGISLTSKAKVGGSLNKYGVRSPVGRPSPVYQNGARAALQSDEAARDDLNELSKFRNPNQRPLVSTDMRPRSANDISAPKRGNLEPTTTASLNRRGEEVTLSE